MRYMLKKELAQHAGVSMRTFSRWMALHRDRLRELGIEPKNRLINPRGVRYICEAYDIDLP